MIDHSDINLQLSQYIFIIIQIIFKTLTLLKMIYVTQLHLQSLLAHFSLHLKSKDSITWRLEDVSMAC